MYPETQPGDVFRVNILSEAHGSYVGSKVSGNLLRLATRLCCEIEYSFPNFHLGISFNG